MTVEIGESLLYSWMKHVRGCHIVQTNWKASPKWKFSKSKKLLRLVEKAAAKKIVPNKRKSKANTLLKRILKEFECDCVGIIKTRHDIEVVGAEIAVHTAGLHYTPSKTSDFADSGKFTAHKIVQKLFVAAIAFGGYLGVSRARLYFITPKIAESLQRDVKVAIDELRKFWKKEAKGFDYSFEVLNDGAFQNDVLNPVNDVVTTVSDGSELFVRCAQIERMIDDVDDDGYEVDEENDEEYSAFEKSHTRNLSRAMELLKQICPNVAAYRNLRSLYGACSALRNSKRDPGGWMSMAIREEFRRRKDLSERPTMWAMKKKYGGHNGIL